MPYASNSDLPQNIRDKYGSCASAFRGAFNSVHDKTGDEGRAFAAAHAAAQRCQRKESSMTLAPTARLSPDVKAPRFSIVTKALGGTTEPDGRRRFRATASSTITDRDGDEITLKALQQMAARFREGVTIFTDHDNKVANAFGTTDTAEIIQRGNDPKTGEPIWDLDIAGTVNEPNPNAIQLHDSITGGYVKLGCSIDAFVMKHQPNQKGRYKVEDIDVFAASIVGVPANQRSWTQKAVRAIKSFYGEPEEDDVAQELTDVTKEVSPESLDAPVETILAETSDEPVEEVAEEAADEVAAAEPETIEKSMCPECGRSKDDAEGCSNSYHSTEKSVEVDDSGGQESAQENPETAPIDTAEADPPQEKAASVPKEDVRELLGHVQRLVKEIEGLRQENERLIALNEKLTKENESVYEEVGLAKQVIGKVMEQPLRSKTAAYVTSFTDAHRLFDPDIAAYLSKRGD